MSKRKKIGAFSIKKVANSKELVTLATVTAGAAGGFISSGKIGDKVTEKLTKMYTDKGKAVPKNLGYYVDGGKVVIGILVAVAGRMYGRKLGAAAADLATGFGIGMAVEGGVSIARKKQWFGLSGIGRNAMNVRYQKKVNGTSDNQERVSGTADNRERVSGGYKVAA